MFFWTTEESLQRYFTATCFTAKNCLMAPLSASCCRVAFSMAKDSLMTALSACLQLLCEMPADLFAARLIYVCI